MNTSEFRLLLDAELSRFNERPIELELFAARLYTSVLDGAYEALHPVAKEVVVVKGKKVAQIKNKYTHGKLTCVTCGELIERTTNVQKRCSITQNKMCAQFTNVKATWERKNVGKTYPFTLKAYIDERVNKRGYVQKRTAVNFGTFNCDLCGKERAKTSARQRFCARVDNPLCNKYINAREQAMRAGTKPENYQSYAEYAAARS
jgi:hypothetical protein